MPSNISEFQVNEEHNRRPETSHSFHPLAPRENLNTQDGGRQQQSMPLGVALTGNRLFTTTWILCLGIPKAVYSYNGQSVVSTTLDWVIAIVFGLLSFWLGVIEFTCPQKCPAFFERDLAAYILKIPPRDDVYFWLASILPLLRAVESMLFVVHTRQHLDEDAISSDSAVTWSLARLTLHSKDGPTRPSPYIQTALGFFMAVVLFFLHGLRVFWPQGSDGNVRHTFLIFNIIMVAHLSFLGVKASRTTSVGPMGIYTSSAGNYVLTVTPNYALVAIVKTICLYIWMMPLALPLASSVGSIPRRSRLLWCACTVIMQVAFYFLEETPKLRSFDFQKSTGDL